MKTALILISSLLIAGLIPPVLMAQRKQLGYEYTLDQKIPMRDDTHLSAFIWKPSGMTEPMPAICVLTPYGGEKAHGDGKFFARNGYVVVNVDVRGRGNSDGEHYPFENDGPDGYDVVEWTARQPWCNGEVGMMGGSYAGMVQWQTLKEMPPHLKTIIPSATPFMGIDVPQPNNIYKTDYTMWLSMVAGKTSNVNIYRDSEFWHSHYYRLYAEGLPYETLAELAGFNQDYYERWMAHPSYDEFWQAMNPSPTDYQRFKIPILSITGYFDGSKAGTLHHYFQHMKYGNEEAKQDHYLIVGPWNHGGTKFPAKTFGGLVFGDNYAVYPNMRRMYLEWFDWIIKGREQPKFLKKRVSCFVMNANKWQYEDRIEDQSNAVDRWYLYSEDGKAQDVLDSGSLVSEAPAGNQKPDIFEYDPLKIMSRAEFMQSVRDPAPYLSQRMAFEEDNLVYHSPPLEDEIRIAGYIKVKLHIELNVPDTDIQVGLFEIRPNGTSIQMAQGWIRARYRNSLSRPELVKPGEINLYEFNILDYFVRKLEKGSRLRLVVSPVNTPLAQKNYNSGGSVSKESAKDARTAIIKLHHDMIHPSLLELPVRK